MYYLIKIPTLGKAVLLDEVTAWPPGEVVTAVAVPHSDELENGVRQAPATKHHRGTTMEHYGGIEVLLEKRQPVRRQCGRRIVRETKVASEPEVLISWFRGLGFTVARIGLEAAPLSQWLYAGMRDAGLAVEVLETRHVRDAFKSMPVKTDRQDARGIAQLMRLGWFRPVDCNSIRRQNFGSRGIDRSKARTEETSLALRRRARRLCMA
jgi:transposase